MSTMVKNTQSKFCQCVNSSYQYGKLSQPTAFALISDCLKTFKSITAPLAKSRLATSVLVTFLGTTVATFVGFGSSTKSATAQIVYPFDVTYDVEDTLTPIPGSDVFEALISGFNPDAQ
ncbi:hypothetical protein [Iningainema tapete]|uniref:Uncharacterized protein n=1 Tax=Iningainema tapete BLCC-T55 TaxID=2748662 RepID=A0A8J7BXC5_9CYAN|nr:hypothetical protein [Iningainema tapete]MBD2773552.1 hypothetical protein [Iningainema tapete BLCC-T55]